MAAGVRQGDLAQAIGLSAGWLSEVEHDRIIPSLQQRISIAKVLGLPLEILFPEDDDE